jgi:hypothetical protein
LAEVSSPSPVSSANVNVNHAGAGGVGSGTGGIRDLKEKRGLLISIIVEGFPMADEDNITCVDIWLKCAFWSQILSKVQYFLQFNVGGKGAVLRRVFAASLLDASNIIGATDLFSIWTGTLTTGCLQPKILHEIGFLSLHKALQIPAILSCIPARKYSFLTSCFSRMENLKAVDVSCYTKTQVLTHADPCVVSGVKNAGGFTVPQTGSGVSSPRGVMETGGDITCPDWQLFTLYTFSVVCASQFNDLRPEERSDVKERQFKPVLDMLHRWTPLTHSLTHSRTHSLNCSLTDSH